MKINVTNILLIALIVIMGWQTFSTSSEEPVKDETIIIPEVKGSTGKKEVEQVVLQPIYLPSSNEKVNVDSVLKDKYEQALKEKDSLTQRTLYLEAIKINKYEQILVDNDSIEIKGYARTRGSLLDYSVDYRIKPFNYTYTPKVIKKRPKLSMGLQVESGIPVLPTTNFLLKGGIYFENNKGNGFSLGYDTQQRLWIGVRKTFTLKK